MTRKQRRQLAKEIEFILQKIERSASIREDQELLETVILKYYIDGQASVIAPIAEIVAKTAQGMGDRVGGVPISSDGQSNH